MSIRALCAGHHLDFTAITEDSPACELAEARATCAECPLLVTCRRDTLLSTDVAGVAGGMTELERITWRAGKHVTVTVPDIADVTPARELRGPLAESLSAELTDLLVRESEARDDAAAALASAQGNPGDALAVEAAATTQVHLAGATRRVRAAMSLDHRLVQTIRRMTERGMTAEEIVEALDHPAITHRTVNYVRHRYLKGSRRGRA